MANYWINWDKLSTVNIGFKKHSNFNTIQNAWKKGFLIHTILLFMIQKSNNSKIRLTLLNTCKSTSLKGANKKVTNGSQDDDSVYDDQLGRMSLLIIITRAETMCNTLRPRQNGRYFADDISKCIFLNENIWISVKFSLKFIANGQLMIFQHRFR